MSKAAKLAAYQKAAGETDPIAMLRRLELSIRDMARVVERAHARGLHAIVTVFSLDLVPEAETLPWDAYKTASPDIIHKPLLDTLAATGKPLIVSTGASTMDEVSRTIDWLRPARERLALLQCVSAYPTARAHAELGGIRALAGVHDGPVGYSDHTDDFKTGFVAVRWGAALLEKHLTHDRSAKGPDHAASLDGQLFAQYVSMARHTPNVPGRWESLIEHVTHRDAVRKVVLSIEEDVRLLSRQSLVTRCALPADYRLHPGDIAIKRPGTGLAPWRLDEIVGRQIARPIDQDVPLVDDDLVPAR